MTLTKGVFQSHAEVDVSPKMVLTKVNSLMYRSIERGSFVSMFYAIIDLVAMKMIYARAGHNPAIYFNRDKNLFSALEPAGIALGLEHGEVFSQVIKEQELSLQSGDLFVFYTDGFSEAMNREQEQYSEERLYDTIKKTANEAAQNIIHAIYLDVKSFTNDYLQHDDMTMVVVKIH
jgi:sigma-B regulation protein RsbU (phosphoserine phosphatase)